MTSEDKGKATELALQSGRELGRATARLWSSRREWWGHTPAERRMHTELAVLTGDVMAARADREDDGVLAAASRLGEASHQALVASDPADAGALLRASRRQLLDLADRRTLMAEGEAVRGHAALPAAQARDLAVTLDHAESSPRGRLEPVRASVAAACRVVDDQAVARERERQRTARDLGLAGVAALLVLVLGAFAVTVGDAPADPGEALRNLDNYNAIVGWGLLGAVVSRVVPWRRPATPAAAEYLHPVTLLGLRLVVGALAAVVFVAVIQADIQSVISINEGEAYPFALAAGFAERLVDRRLGD